ncbi:MAG: TetR/AcrR family transcriptional regulator [Lachnospiraceae bacterium]|nr:TetR/AcrR family transcriptional regulator [Lachnospiraceae bacterium]
MPEERNTLDRILCSAKKEFMEKGFLNASLRSIVKNAGVTTGAFYRYYDSKESLFAALVDEQASYILALFNHTIDDFEKLPGEQQTEKMIDTSSFCLEQMVDYIYEHFDAFKLLIQSAEGTAYADFIHQLVVREVESTYTYMQTLKDMGCKVEPLNKNLIHIIASGLFSGIFELVIHDMPKEEALEYLSQFQRFYSAGWSELLNVKFGK